MVSESSPRLWGAPAPGHASSRAPRVIPTPVGSTCFAPCCNKRLPSHPHACGEHPAILPITPPVNESSPRLWGARLECGFCNLPRESSPRLWGARRQRLQASSRGRVIPTPVGSTRVPGTRCRADSSHPHACGEHLLLFAVREVNPESSPRLWGARGERSQAPPPVRVIPTPVGSTTETGCA